jgi:Mrp family chromosome partitioning ATPase
LPELVESLKGRYTYVVIEVPGVLEYPDAVHLSCLADVSLLSLQRNTSVAGSVVQAQAALAQHGRPVFGTMIA